MNKTTGIIAICALFVVALITIYFGKIVINNKAAEQARLEALATDNDGDGFSEDQGDCDDTTNARHSEASEGILLDDLLYADGIDNDCDDIVDEGTISPDKDNDNSLSVNLNKESFFAPDCDDERNFIFPNALERPNGMDDDCDGIVDEGTDLFDDDEDGFTEKDGDCNDHQPNRFPDAPEGQLVDGQLFGDSIDNDCDGVVDEGATDVDNDHDGYCEHTECYDTRDKGGDCDDENNKVFPGALEFTPTREGEIVLDGIDNDCDGIVDNNTPLYDDDGDGFSENDGDCDDTNKFVFPGAPEENAAGVIDKIDNDCDGIVDEGTRVFYHDGDKYTEENCDCNYKNPRIHSKAKEWVDGVDNNCNDLVDEGVPPSLPSTPSKANYPGGIYYVVPKAVLFKRAGSWDEQTGIQLASVDWESDTFWLKTLNRDKVTVGKISESSPKVTSALDLILTLPSEDEKTGHKALLRFDQRLQDIHVKVVVSQGPGAGVRVALNDPIDGIVHGTKIKSVYLSGYPNNTTFILQDGVKTTSLIFFSCNSEHELSCELIGTADLTPLKLDTMKPGSHRALKVNTVKTHDATRCANIYTLAGKNSGNTSRSLGAHFHALEEACAPTGTANLTVSVTATR